MARDDDGGRGTGAERSFWAVVDWAEFQYSDRRKVPRPPWKWFRVQIALLRSPEWLAMTRPQRADFIAVLGTASETGNMTPDDPRWLATRSLSRRALAALSRHSLVERFSLPFDDPRIKELRRILSGAAPDSEIRDQKSEAESPDQGDQSPTPTTAAPAHSNAPPPEVTEPKGQNGGGTQQPEFEIVVTSLLAANPVISPSDWPGIEQLCVKQHGFTPSGDQLSWFQRQMNDRLRR